MLRYVVERGALCATMAPSSNIRGWISPSRRQMRFRFAYTGVRRPVTLSNLSSQNLDAQIGLQNTTTDPREFGLPSVSVTGFSGFRIVLTDHQQHHGPFPVRRRFPATLAASTTSKMGSRYPASPLSPAALGPGSARHLDVFGRVSPNPGPGLAGGNALAEFLLGTPTASSSSEVGRAGFRRAHESAEFLLPGRLQS